MPRVPKCDFKEEGCDDPRCSLAFCVLQKEQAEKSAAQEASGAERIRKRAEEITQRGLKNNGIRNPTWEQVRRLSQTPRLLEIAEKQLADEDAIFGRSNSD